MPQAERPRMDQEQLSKKNKLGVVSGVYIPVCLNILSILMFLRFGLILGQVGLLGILGLMVVAYSVDFVTTLSLSAIASNGEVKGGGAYYLISRSLGPEFGGSIGLLFYLAQVLNTALNVVGLIDCLRLSLGPAVPSGYWWDYLFETAALVVCTALCLAGSRIFAKASNGLLAILVVAIISIPFSAVVLRPFRDPTRGIDFTGVSLATLRSNLLPHRDGEDFHGLETFRSLFGIFFPATSGIFAGASMSGDLKNPSKAIPSGTLWAMLSTFIAYLLVIISMAASTSHSSFLRNANILQDINIWAPIILAGECATTFFSALMGLIGSAKLMQALARDKLFPGLSLFGQGTKKADEPVLAIILTYLAAQLALFANLNQIATLISMGYQMTFFVMNLACFLLKVGSAPNFRPGFKFFTWQSAFAGSLLSAAAMFFVDETYASTAVCLLIFLFLLIHYLSPPKHWGDVSQNLIYHQVRKYLLRLKPEHIKFWRPQIILLINDPRRQTRLIQFCNSMKKGALYILGHVIVTDDFPVGVREARLQQAAWTKYISEYSRIKAFVQLTMSPTITWGVRNLILSAGLGGMRPNIAVLGFYNMDELRGSEHHVQVPEPPLSPTPIRKLPAHESKSTKRRRGDTSARLLEGYLPTDAIRTEDLMSVTSYLTILEDLALRYRLNVAVAKGFQSLETPRKDGVNTKKFIDLWPIQMSAELSAEGKNVLTTNFDTYTLILQLGYILHTVPTWKRVYRLRVLVFVEYESEVEEERGRVKALLDKLRIEAEVLVFWLACGQLLTYESIIQGRCDDPEIENLVNDCLKEEEWWEDLRTIRGATESMSASQELNSLTNVMESTSGRPGVYNPHTAHEESKVRRRSSLALLSDLPRKPTVSRLVRMGVNMGIHTQNLPPSVFDDSDSENGAGAESSSDTSEERDLDGDFNDAASVASEGDLGQFEAFQHPILSIPQRRKSHAGFAYTDSPKKRPEHRRPKVEEAPKNLSYGTVSSSSQSLPGMAGPGQNKLPKSSRLNRGKPLGSPWPPSPLSSSPPRPASAGGTRADPSTVYQGNVRPERPPLSRQGSSAVRFSSTLVPQTRITNEEGSGPKIMFADSGTASLRPDRTTFSRQSSTTRLTSRLVSEMKVATPSENGAGPAVSFAETPTRSRKGSAHSATHDTAAADVQIDIPRLLEGYRSSTREREQEDHDGHSSGGSSYSTQDLPLSFNDVPSRAQHLILNELMRQNSTDTAVLFTTLPIPEEGTCESQGASLRYLSSIEVLCNELPPVLLVLSNNMTVTVSL